MTTSRASTVTLGAEWRHATRHPSESENVVRFNALEQAPSYHLQDNNPGPPLKRLIVAIDFGTTYSAVSYVALESGESIEDVGIDQVRSIQNYPDDWNTGGAGDRMKSEVPTEVIYPLNRYFRDEENTTPEQSLRADGEGEADYGAEGDVEMEDASFDGDNDDDVFDFEPQNDSVGEISTGVINSFRWGYGVHEAWGLPATHANPKNQALARFKLLLDNSPMTSDIRERLKVTLKELRQKNIIQNDLDVIVDFLTRLLGHAKVELEQAGFDDGYQVEMVLCVPAIWTQKACRDMQAAMAKAMQRTRFGGVDVQNDSIESLFIVSEPEAAAAYVLATDAHNMLGDTFVLLDAGGGTVDANTYTVSLTTPLRLVRKVDTPDGGLFGSSYVNQEFRDWLTHKLEGETYLEDETNTIRGHIEKIMINDFEYRTKRSFDLYTMRPNRIFKFHVPNLRDNPAKGFRESCVIVSADTMKGFFKSCLRGIVGIMEGQINAAREKGARVEKVLLIGGFAASVSVQKYLRHKLKKYCSDNGCHIVLVVAEDTATAVASGAVLRAINKERGPRREAKSSYGVLRTEPHGEFPEHEGIKPSYDHLDGLPYVVNTIDWVLKLGQEVDPVWECRLMCSHTFECRARQFLCKEVLYVSDHSTQSHFQLKHTNNIGAEKVGEIVVDFTFLRDDGLIYPVHGAVNDNGKRVGKRHYRVNYTMLIRVVDRDLRCYAIYEGQEMQRCRINIASAFSPGIK